MPVSTTSTRPLKAVVRRMSQARHGHHAEHGTRKPCRPDRVTRPACHRAHGCCCRPRRHRHWQPRHPVHLLTLTEDHPVGRGSDRPRAPIAASQASARSPPPARPAQNGELFGLWSTRSRSTPVMSGIALLSPDVARFGAAGNGYDSTASSDTPRARMVAEGFDVASAGVRGVGTGRRIRCSAGVRRQPPSPGTGRAGTAGGAASRAETLNTG